MIKTGSWVIFTLTDSKMVMLENGTTVQLADAFDVTKIHQTQGGQLVGIFQDEGIAPEDRGKPPEERRMIPANIVPVAKDTGLNLRFLLPGQAVGHLLAVLPAAVKDLQLATNRDQLPKLRIAAALAANPDWQPQGYKAPAKPAATATKK